MTTIKAYAKAAHFGPTSEDDIDPYQGEGTLCPHCGARDWQLLLAVAEISMRYEM